MQKDFVDNNDGTVSDTTTGLMWQQDSASNSMTWKKATAYCKKLNLGGYTDWRLPAIHELKSLVDYSRCEPAIDNTYFSDTVSSWFYWSSTAYASVDSGVWGVAFDDGNDDGYENDQKGYVRAVRGGRI